MVGSGETSRIEGVRAVLEAGPQDARDDAGPMCTKPAAEQRHEPRWPETLLNEVDQALVFDGASPPWLMSAKAIKFNSAAEETGGRILPCPWWGSGVATRPWSRLWRAT